MLSLNLTVVLVVVQRSVRLIKGVSKQGKAGSNTRRQQRVRIKGSACGPLMRHPCFPKSTFFASLFTWYTVLSRMPAWQQRQGQGSEIDDTTALPRVANCSSLWQTPRAAPTPTLTVSGQVLADSQGATQPRQQAGGRTRHREHASDDRADGCEELVELLGLLRHHNLNGRHLVGELGRGVVLGGWVRRRGGEVGGEGWKEGEVERAGMRDG